MLNKKLYQVKNVERAGFFSALKDGDVLMVNAIYSDGSTLGKIHCNGEQIYFGPAAENKFQEIHAWEAAHWELMKIKVKATTGFDPRQL